ncbi:MAG: ABC transporter permease [Thermoanaerobaculia bacterium]
MTPRRRFDPARLWAMTRKETLQLRRDRRSLLLAFALPLVLLIIFGYAIVWDVRDIALAVVDQDRSPESRELVDGFLSSGYFHLAARPARAADATLLFARGTARLVLVVPPGFAADLGAGRTAVVQVLLDGSDANTATISLAYAEAVAASFGQRIVLHGERLTLPLTAQSRVWYNETLASRDMIVPGLVAVIMMVIAAMLTSLTIAREWERGTMEQLVSTPVTRFEVVLGKLLPYLVIGLVDVAAVSALGVALFGVPLRGNALLLFPLSFLFLCGSLGLGLFISAVSRSQVLATQIALVATFLPAFLLSGFMFAIENMPPVLRAISYLVPARYFLVVTRGIFLKGVGIGVLRHQALLMLAFAVVGLALAVRSFRKELD